MIQKYTLTARILHWLTVIAIFFALRQTFYWEQFPKISMERLHAINYHKWAGITVLLLVIIRLLWRFWHRPPALPKNVPVWQKKAALFVQWLLYLLMIVVPLLGWLYSSARGYPVVWFGVLPLPNLISQTTLEFAKQIEEVHAFAAWSLIVLAVGHALAALKHHFIDKDVVLKQML